MMHKAISFVLKTTQPVQLGSLLLLVEHLGVSRREKTRRCGSGSWQFAEVKHETLIGSRLFWGGCPGNAVVVIVMEPGYERPREWGSLSDQVSFPSSPWWFFSFLKKGEREREDWLIISLICNSIASPRSNERPKGIDRKSQTSHFYFAPPPISYIYMYYKSGRRWKKDWKFSGKFKVHSHDNKPDKPKMWR